MRVALAQMDTTPGDVRGNAARIRDAWARARTLGADLVLFPELALPGYPARDLLLREGFVRAVQAEAEGLARDFAPGPPAVLGSAVRNPAPTGRGLCNAALFLRGGRVEAVYAKRLLPTYDVFDEARYFAPGSGPVVVEVGGRRVGLTVCEDLWVEDRVAGRRLYEADPPGDLARAGVDLVVNLAASPYHVRKDARRVELFSAQAARVRAPLLCVHLVGADDDVLFDGTSRAFDAQGRPVARLPSFEEALEVVDLERLVPLPPPPPPDEADEVRAALVMGIAGYARKVGLPTAVVGLSGGVDSAVTACLAAQALGPSRVTGVAMPGPFSAPESLEDARELARRLGIAFRVVPIVPPYEACLRALLPHFEGKPFDVAEENLQARLRGMVLMALSNKHGHLVLTTGNKSELAVGYCTLYGDMCGGLAAISDLWKTRVYAVAEAIQRRGEPIPRRTIDRPPTAELRPDQLDSDSLPPYEVLDRILVRRVEEGAGLEEIVAAGEDRATVERILRSVDRNEYKRRQMPPGLKVTPTAFGVGWRMPLARPPLLD